MRWSELPTKSLIPVILGVTSGLAAIGIQRLEYALSIAFVLASLVCLVTFPTWRLGVLFVVILGAPPFLDYELAWTAITAFRSSFDGALRADITQPILSAFDLCIAVALVLAIRRGIDPGNRNSIRIPLWYAVGLLLLSALRLASSANAMITYPQYARTVWAGIASVLRVVAITVLTVAGLRSDRDLRNTEVGLCVGVMLFVAQSLYISFVKSAGIRLGVSQLTGLIPGPGATGAMMVLVVPTLVASALAATGRHRNFLLVSSLAGMGMAAFTYSRNVIVGMIVSMLVLLAGARLLRLHGARKMATGFSFVILAASLKASDWIRAKFGATLATDLSATVNLGARYIYWQVAASLVKENWLLGHGALMWGMVAQGFGSNAHNAFIQFAVENGVLALVLFAVLLAMACGVAYHSLHYTELGSDRHLAVLRLGALSGVVGFCTSQLVSESLGHIRVNLAFWILVAVMLTRDDVAADTATPTGMDGTGCVP